MSLLYRTITSTDNELLVLDNWYREPIMCRNYAKIFFLQIVKFPAISSEESLDLNNLTLTTTHNIQIQNWLI